MIKKQEVHECKQIVLAAPRVFSWNPETIITRIFPDIQAIYQFAKGDSFVVETTLAGKYFVDILAALKVNGYRTEIIYIFRREYGRGSSSNRG